MTTTAVTRQQVLAFRLHQHQLEDPGRTGDVALLDYGIQDTGPDGAAWAMAVRGGSTEATEVALAWTLRGAPHAYRQADLGAVSVATAPYSEADAAKRIFDASKPLQAAGIDTLDALRVVAHHLRELAKEPIVKGDASGALRDLVEAPYLRFCRSCDAIHIYELPFRLAALQAGLELEAGTSPPVLRRIPKLVPNDLQHLAGEAEPRFDVIRNHLRFYGPATAKDASAHLDMPLSEVKAHWPEDVVEVVVDGVPATKGSPRYLLDEDLDALRQSTVSVRSSLVLLGPFDPYLQTRDRELLAGSAAHRKALWPVLGRPGAMVLDGEVIATWRPKTTSGKLTIRLEPWTKLAGKVRDRIGEQCDRLAQHRGVVLTSVVDE